MWKSKQKVAPDGAPAAMKLDVRSARRARQNRRDDEARKLREFFRTLGKSVESLIDATPLGVPDPEPWNPATDRKKALLSNPAVSVLQSVSDTIDALSPAQLLGKVEGARGCSRAAACSGANSKRSAKPVQEALVEAKNIRKVTVSKILAFVDNLTLRANGLVVTADDCSVECSLASLADEDFEISSPVPGCISSDEDDFEDCPSVVTEVAVDELEDTPVGRRRIPRPCK
ncbi:hypothetical protein ACHAXT_009431 [Thalassiosira profunda]